MKIMMAIKYILIIVAGIVFAGFTALSAIYQIPIIRFDNCVTDSAFDAKWQRQSTTELKLKIMACAVKYSVKVEHIEVKTTLKTFSVTVEYLPLSDTWFESRQSFEIEQNL